MQSPAALQFQAGLVKARVLRAAFSDRGKSAIHRQIGYHASLAASVAAWETYLTEIVRLFFLEVAAPHDIRFQSLHSIAREEAERKLARFHTPNWENARDLLIMCTGYDPLNDWTWLPANLGAQQVRELLNEILRVRHSFAHGFPMPSYRWNRSSTGQVRLDVQGLRRVESLFSHLVQQSDRGFQAMIAVQYGRRVTW